MIQGSSPKSLGTAVALFATLALMVGCGPKPALQPPVPPPPDPCAVGPEGVPGAAGAATPVRIALDQTIDWNHAPAPVNDAERLVFRQCFETLVRVDCTGRIRPGLAESWESTAGGQVWTFTLRPGARFWDGEQADAFAVARALQGVHGRDSSLPRELRWIDVESVEAVGARRLRVGFAPHPAVIPRLEYFAHPALAVVKFTGNMLRPVGTGRLRIDDAADDGGIRLVPHRESRWNRDAVDAASPPESDGPVLRIRSVPGADPRDLLAEGADLVIGRSHSFTDYAGQLPEFTVVPLPWDRIYVLLATGATGSDTDAPRIAEGGLAGLRDDLAAQGSAADARPAHGLSFDVTLSGKCPPAERMGGARGSRPSEPRIVYPAGDADAGLLAERVAALAIMGSPRLRDALPGSFLAGRDVSPRTQALSRTSWRGALSGQNEYGYIYPVRREVFDHCGVLAGLRDRVPWVITGDGDRGPNFLPLVVTRPVVALRRGLGGLRTDGDGTLLLDGAGWVDAGMTP